MIERQQLKPILSPREIDVVTARLNNKPITQTESNYLSRSIRPKLAAARYASQLNLLPLLDYRRRKYEREDIVLKQKLLSALSDVSSHIQAIVLFGGYVRNNHTYYGDIDIMIVVKKKLWKTQMDKYKLKKKIESAVTVPIDIMLIEHSYLKKHYPYNPLLHHMLEDHNVIYGAIKLGKKLIVNRWYLWRELLEIDTILETSSQIESKYIYNALRTCLAINQFLKKKVNHNQLLRVMQENIGSATALALKNNTSNPVQRKIALCYLRYLYHSLEKALKYEQKKRS
ncbi:nucleotidyltransferase domain-containing protein [Candidatus Woesearchaeota archaeon]|nr:nucleotidyltransferase domain-containing protein [Candidatus Woesearchaeota archaeon]